MTELVHLDPGCLAEIIASATDAIVNADGEQRIVLFNAAAERMFGRSAAEMIGSSVRRIVVEGLLNGAPSHDLRVATPGGSVRHTQRLCLVTGIKADGTQFPIEAAVSHIDVGGRSIFTAILRDISERVRALEILRRSEQAFAETFANSPIGLMCVTPDGKVERVNAAQLQLLDRSSDEVLGRAVADLHANGDHVDALLTRLAEGETVHDYHLHAVTAQGLRHLLVDANGVWEQSVLIRSRWFVRDITSRIKLEVEILTIAENERQRIGQDLHDDVCQQLVAIEFMVEAMATGMEGKSRAAEQAHGISRHLRTVIDRTREIARGMAPSLPDQPEGLMTALQELADRTTKVFQRECRFECPKPALSSDPAATMHLYRIAQEAVRNAIKHGQAQRITIRLFMNGTDLVLGVSDNGNGASPDPEKRQGMGLRVMQYRAGVIGGTLVIQRVPDEGTSVICTVKTAAGEPKASP